MMPSPPTLTRRVVAFTGACAAMAWSFGSSPVAQTKPPADRFTVTLAGAIGKTAAYAALKIDGEQVSGTYAYAHLNQPLTLAGRRASGGRVTLDETDGSGRTTGHFTGDLRTFNQGDDVRPAFVGAWTRADGSGSTPFALYEQIGEDKGVRLTVRPFAAGARARQVEAVVPALVAPAGIRIDPFNEAAAKLVGKRVAAFTAALTTTDPKRESFSSGVDVQVMAHGLVSVRFVFWEYEGGAHGNYGFHGLTYDIQTGRVLTLGDLFTPTSGYLEGIAAYCEKNLLDQLDSPDKDWVKKGAAPKPDVYETLWTLTDEGLQITFDPYLVAPYAAGAPEVVIDFAELKKWARPDGPLSRFAQK